MPYKIAVPDNPIFLNLLAKGIDEKDNSRYEILPVSEARLSDLMLDNRVDLALMSPFSFGKGVGLSNYIILPTSIIALEGYTGIASFFFKQTNRKELTCSSNDPDTFVMIIGKILLAELYGIHPEVKKVKGDWKELLESSDIVLTWGTAPQKEMTLDISEEWFLHFGHILPIAFWVCRDEENNNDLLNLTKEMVLADLAPQVDIVEDNTSAGNYQPRGGRIIYQWNSEIKNALEQTLKILYYHQYIDEIPEISVLSDI